MRRCLEGAWGSLMEPCTMDGLHGSPQAQEWCNWHWLCSHNPGRAPHCVLASVITVKGAAVGQLGTEPIIPTLSSHFVNGPETGCSQSRGSNRARLRAWVVFGDTGSVCFCCINTSVSAGHKRHRMPGVTRRQENTMEKGECFFFNLMPRIRKNFPSSHLGTFRVGLGHIPTVLVGKRLEGRLSGVCGLWGWRQAREETARGMGDARGLSPEWQALCFWKYTYEQNVICSQRAHGPGEETQQWAGNCVQGDKWEQQ